VWRRLLLALLAAGAVLAGAEMWLRTQPAPFPTYGWRELFGRVHEQNQLGLRGQEITYGDGDFVVVLVGDSQGGRQYLRAGGDAGGALQHHLAVHLGRPVRVFSLGAVGYGQDQQLGALTDYLAQFRADAVVVWFTDGNDTWNNASVTHSGGWPAKPTYRLDAAGELVGPHARAGDPVVSRWRLWAAVRRACSGSVDDDWDQTLPPPYQPMTSWDGAVQTAWGDCHTTHVEFAKERTAVALALDPPSARTRYAIALTNKLLHRMRGLVLERGGKFFSFVALRPDFPLADGVYRFAGPHGQPRFVRLSRAQHAASVGAVHKGIDLVQLPVTVTPFCPPGDPHFNPAAVDQLMLDLAHVLSERRPR
jgi:hypothetical protein